MEEGIYLTKKNLNEVQWFPFSLGNTEIFNLYATKSGLDKNKLSHTSTERFPYITRSELNNGVSMFVSRQLAPLNPKNTISIGLDTQSVFYQPFSYYTGQNVQVLDFPELTLKTALFIIPLIKIQLTNLNWGGNGATLSRLRAKKIMLPAYDKDHPDWQFMSDYISEKISNYNVPVWKDARRHSSQQLENKCWKPIAIGSLFDITRGKSGPKNKLSHGNVPLISARKVNNGLSSFVHVRETYIESGHVLSVNNNGDGGAGIAYYQSFPFTATQDVSILTPKNSLTEYTLLFLATVITMQSSKFGFGNKANAAHLKKQVIMLPFNEMNYPDWQFMDSYIRSLPNSNLI